MNRARIALVLCAALVTDGAFAATATLQTIAVTPTAPMITVGQKQSFTATGTFSNGSTHILGPAISSMSLGQAFTCALQTSGGMECWGAGNYGILGDGTTAGSLSPRTVKASGPATGLSVALDHTCAVLASGTVQCWGRNSEGMLGDGTTTNSSLPRTVSGIGTAVAVGAGDVHSCAVLANGTVKCWGDNSFGELGDASNAASQVPVTVSGVSTAISVSLGQYHSCALLASGAVQCWGDNYYGQLGNNSSSLSSNVPVAVSGISTATAIAVRGIHSCALLANSTIQCWGSNQRGELGAGSTAFSSRVPLAVAGITTATLIAAGVDYNCAVLRNGFTKCWGSNEFGQAGHGIPDGANAPVRFGAINRAIVLATGREHTCALFATGAMKCWGLNNAGQLGNRRKTGGTWPVNVIGTPGVMWTSSDPSKATITDRGVATGGAVGNTTITATTAGFINDNAVLTVH